MASNNPPKLPEPMAGDIDKIFNEMVFVGKSLAQIQRIPKTDLERAEKAKEAINAYTTNKIIEELELYLENADPNYIDYAYIKPRIKALNHRKER